MTAPVYIRSMAVAMAPMTVGCTRCLAGRGSHCESSGGYRNSAVGFHAARKAAVAHLSEQQRYDAYAEMRAEEAALRASVSARLRQPLTPEQQASRRATGEAWARTDAEVRQWRRDRVDVLTHSYGCRCRTEQPARQPLGPIRGVAPVGDLSAARRRRALRSVPDGAA